MLSAEGDLFLSGVYDNLLARKIDEGGAQFWNGLLDAGATKEQVILGVQSSDEFRASALAAACNSLSSGALVEHFYAEFLNRAADDGGLNFWISRLDSDGADDVIAGILATGEAQEQFAREEQSGNSSVIPFGDSMSALSAHQPAKAIDAGGSATAWYSADGSFSGGSVSTTTSAIDVTKTYHPAPEAVYKSVRFGNFTYTLSGLTANAKYQVRLHFAEYTGGFNVVGARVFDVRINGALVLDNYDIFADTGYKIAVVKPFNATASAGGAITVQFTSVVNNSSLAGIEITPGTSYFISAGDTAMKQEFQQDQFHNGGATFTTTNTIDTSRIQSPPPQSVFQSERWNSTNVVYTLPNLVAGQRYNVRLYFAEIYGFVNGPGQRVFDVQINGTRVLDNFDPYDAAGGRDIAIERTFEAVANASGQVVITLVPVVSNPKISGFEISPQVSYMFNAGGPAVAPFVADMTGYYGTFGGGIVSTANAIDLTGVSNPAPEAVYKNAIGTVAGVYALPALMPGKFYRARLHFAEIDPTKFSIGARKFNIFINGFQAVKDFDIYDTAAADLPDGTKVGAGYKAVIREITFAADKNGRFDITLVPVTGGQAIVNGIEVDREPLAAGYSATEIGMVGQPDNVHGRDGGVSALVGNKVLWFFGDTAFSPGSGGGSTPPNVSWWTNTAGLSDKRTPWNLTESLTAGGSPTGQMVPFINSQYTYNQAHLGGWGGDNTSYYAQWPGSVIREVNGNGLVFSGNTMVNVNGLPGKPPGSGIVTYVQPAGVNPTNNSPVGSQNVLFAENERHFSRAFVGNDGYVYSYVSELGDHGKLASQINAGATVTSLPLTGRVSSPILAGQTIELVNGANKQIVTVSATAAPQATSISVNSFVANATYPVNTTIVHSGTPIGALSTSLPAGTPRTQIQVSHGLPTAVTAGQTIELWSGNNVLSVVASANAAAGATTINVNSFTPAVTYPVGTAVQQVSQGFLTAQTYVARALHAPVGNAAIRANWTFWNQRLNNFQGGWDTAMTNGTPLLYTDGAIRWMGAPSVSWNAYLGKYLGIRGGVINGSIYLTTANSPQGPWTPEVEITKSNTTINGLGNYFTVQHPEMDLSNGQTIYVTYSHNGGERTPVIQIMLP